VQRKGPSRGAQRPGSAGFALALPALQRPRQGVFGQKPKRKAMNHTSTTTETIDVRRHRIKAALAAHHGSLERTRHWTRRLIYTPGVADMAELCGAYWLIDLIASHQINRKVAAEEFQVWTLNVQANQGLARATDGNNKLITCQQIEYTDFPLHEIKLYLDQGTLMLPGEY
jgi:hypothetical protein